MSILVGITLITPHQRPNSGGVYAIEQFARHAAALTDVHVIVAKGKPRPIDGVSVHGSEALAELALPEADVLLIPADMRNAEQLFGLAPDCGMPMLLFQGYGTPNDPIVHANLVQAPHAVCTASWLVEEAARAGCTATLVRYGLDRQIFLPGGPPEARQPVVTMMTHPLDWKGTADGLEALALARREVDEIELRLFGKLDPSTVDPAFADVPYLAAPNEMSAVAALLRECAVLVCPSWEEGFGMPGIEAIASGAALATTDTKGSRDYAFDDRTAMVSPPRDPQALARNVVQLIRDPGLRTRLVDAGRRQIDATFPDWERATEVFVAAVHTAASTMRATRLTQPTPKGQASVDHELGLDADLLAARLRRESRRAKLLLREAEVERHELEAELARRSKESADARRRARELQGDVAHERDAREKAQVAQGEAEEARAAAEARAARATERAARGDERVTALESAAERLRSEAERAHIEFSELRKELRTTVEALSESTHELDDARARLDQLERAKAEARRELAALSSELELSSSRTQRAQAALGRARADLQVAEAEREALEQQVVDLASRLERGGDGGGGGSETGEPPSEPAPSEGGNGSPPRSQLATLAEVQLLPQATSVWAPVPESEREVQAMFVSEYQELLALVPPSPDRRDPLALPVPADMRDMLATTADDQEPGQPSIDVIVCVRNALEDLRRCLWSLLHRATRRFRLILVNDGSDEATTAFLAQLAEKDPAVTLIHRSDPPHGYTLAANAGMRASTSEYLVLLNSDTMVSHRWLERIVVCGERDDRVGILGPLSNSATHQSVPERRSEGEWATNPLPDWLPEDGMALILQRAAPRTNTRLPFINGFCYVIRRGVIDAIGHFDEESFPAGYAEENDFSQRAREAGFELGVVDDAYVFHAKSKSYGADRKPISRRGYQIFLDKHGHEKINALVKVLDANTTLGPVRTAVAEAISSPEATESALALDAEQRQLSVAFVLPGLGDGGSGGSHSIYQEVHGLRRLGVPAKIMLSAGAWNRAQSAYDDAAAVFEPFESTEELARQTADAKVIVATHFKSVAMLAALRAHRADFLPAYYVQDYEPMFKFADDADHDEAARSYTAIPDALLFAKTHWLCNVVALRHGVFVAKVEPSIDSSVYHPGEPGVGDSPLRVTAMLRPRTPRRQPYSTIDVLERLLDVRGGHVEVTTFGCREADLHKLTKSPAIHAGHHGLLKRDQVAELLRRSDVFLDMSTYQAFGRTAVEAMACGATAIVPRLGGVWEFVDHGHNALAVDTMNREEAFAAINSLVDDRDRLAELKAGAVATGSRCSILRAAISEYVVLSSAYESRFG